VVAFAHAAHRDDGCIVVAATVSAIAMPQRDADAAGISLARRHERYDESEVSLGRRHSAVAQTKDGQIHVCGGSGIRPNDDNDDNDDNNNAKVVEYRFYYYYQKGTGC
jgi:hypothetical protein